MRLFDVHDCDPPYEFVAVEPAGDAPIPEAFRDRILVHTVHDGSAIPARFLHHEDGSPRLDSETVENRYIEERDWGANLVASQIASAMGLPGYGRVRLARVLLDFNRFPGSTPHDDAVLPLNRLAINHPFARVLAHEEKFDLLERYYDGISSRLESEFFRERLLTLAVHTYDELNPTQTRRPHLSLLSSVKGYQEESRMPLGVFDPLYPDVLGESTCSRILRDRVSLTLERNGFRVSHNYPYALPAGCVEVRTQVWCFFRYLKKRFLAEHPETENDRSYGAVWNLLLNTNLRSQQAESMRSYVHRFRKPAPERADEFRTVRQAYERLEAFLERSSVVQDFRRSPDRPSSLGLEVRKDLLCTFDDRGRPLPLRPSERETAAHIGRLVAFAINTFLTTDREYL
ncbi:MAG: N-formylglutamate amidohydrolase [Myxococcota bacterium]